MSVHKYCLAGIVFEAYSPLGNPGNPFVDVPRILDDNVVKEIATKHSATPAQVSHSGGRGSQVDKCMLH